MAETVHLFLKAKGNDIQGESTQTSLGRANSIECIYFDHMVSSPRDASTGMATGRRQYSPIVIRKRIDKATPLLFKALTTNQPIEGIFKFFRPNPTGDGTTEQFYTITIKKGQITSIRNYLPDTLMDTTSQLPALEEITFTFNDVTWTYSNGGITHTDNLGGR